MATDRSTDGSYRECVTCGTERRLHLSAYDSWDEVFMLSWTPASTNTEHIRESDSRGRHPETQRRVFCSRDCLDAFIHTNCSLKPESVDTDTD
jgi:hypothetical protein